MKLLFIAVLYFDAIDTNSLIAGTSQLASTAIGAMAQANLNSKTRDWNYKMYEIQRGDALSDRDSANAYNSPSQQMARFQSAGLNPNLVYGQSGAQASQPVRSSSPMAWNPKAPDYSGIAQGLGNAMSIKLQQSQLDNQEAQRQLINAQTNATNVGAQKTQAEIPGVGISQASSQFDLDMKRSLSDITKAQSYADLQGTLSRVQNTLTDTQTKQIMQAPNLASAVANIIRTNAGTYQTIAETNATNARIQGILSDNQIKAAEARLAQFNIFKSDPEWIRAAILLAQPQNNNPNNAVNPYNPKQKIPQKNAKQLKDMMDSENGQVPNDPSTQY